jgi:hypothetical protein
MKSPITFWRGAVFPAAVAATILGGSAALAAPAQASAPAASQNSAKFTWHKFTFVNGWKSASSSVATGTPGWAVHDNVVYLRGAIKDTTPGSSTVFGTLPASARPAHNLYINIYTQDDLTGYVYIGQNGTLSANNGGNTTFASLAAISFPLASIATHKLALKNGWESDQPTFGTGDPAYSVSKGIVYLSGSLADGRNGFVATILPKAARPGHQVYLSVYTDGGTTGTLEILPGGGIRVSGESATGYTSLADISFPVAGTKWHDFKLINNWKSAAVSSPSGNPGYAVINGVVYLTGAMYEAPADNHQWTELPAAIQPLDALEIGTYTYAGSLGLFGLYSTFALISSLPFSNAADYTELAALAYPLTS